MDLVANSIKYRLTKQNYLGSGGEGDLYVVNNTVFKIYQQGHRVISDQKIKELGVLQLPFVTPLTLCYSNNKPVGYTMVKVSGEPLAKFFTRSFKDRKGVTINDVLTIISDIRSGIEYAHTKDILLVDINEFNFLVGDSVYFIDVDGYQTKSFPATALMESVRDYHSNSFNELTDWFSFGIISFQLLIGIHPFKGKYNGLGLKDRMLQNISVLDSRVSIPKACESFSVIPTSYINWFRAIFNGKRLPPPTSFDRTSVKLVTTQSSQGLVITFIEEFANLFTYKGYPILVGEHAILVSGEKVVFLNNQFYKNGHQLKLLTQLDIKSCTTYDNRIYVLSGEHVYESVFLNNSVAYVPVANVTENSTTIYDGCVISQLLGEYYCYTFPTSRASQAIRLDCLRNKRVVDAKFSNGILVVIAFDGEYNQYIFSNSDAPVIVKDVNSINFICLNNGICINETGVIQVFNKSNIQKVKIIDTNLTLRLDTDGTAVFGIENNKIYNVSMK